MMRNPSGIFSLSFLVWGLFALLATESLVFSFNSLSFGLRLFFKLDLLLNRQLVLLVFLLLVFQTSVQSWWVQGDSLLFKFIWQTNSIWLGEDSKLEWSLPFIHSVRMDRPQILDMVEIGILVEQQECWNWDCQSVKIVPEDTVSLEERTVLSEEWCHNSSLCKLIDQEPC